MQCLQTGHCTFSQQGMMSDWDFCLIVKAFIGKQERMDGMAGSEKVSAGILSKRRKHMK